MAVQQPIPQQQQQTEPVLPHWQPPSSGRFKCNVDAAFSDQFQRTCIGICVRDDSRTFVLAKVHQFNHIYPVAIGEALGLYHALQWMTNMQFELQEMPSTLAQRMLQNLEILLVRVDNCSPLLSQTQRLSLFGDKRMRRLMR